MVDLGSMHAGFDGPSPPVAAVDLAAGALSVMVSTDTTPIVVTLAGELDLATAASLRSALDKVLAAIPAAVVIDLAPLGFIDASGLAVLAAARRSLLRKGGDVVIRNPSPTLRKMLAITSLAGMVQETAALRTTPETIAEDI